MAYRYPTSSVASGTFAVVPRRKEILEAYLGSCVGVAIYDREAGVGGLAHFLLPEPTGMDCFWQPETYAATGLPLFLDALEVAGASPENMEAVVAGGALVGVLSECDLELDIGGRTADVVEKVLRRKGIPIGTQETGGFFTCRLGLNLYTFQCHIAPFGPDRVDDTPKELFPLSLERLQKALQTVSPIPQIALKIIRMIRRRTYDMEQVAEETRRDQVISAKVIRLCNSARFGIKTDAIDRALIMIGEKRLMQFILTAALEDFFPERDVGYSICKGGLYKHALGTAMTAEGLANFTGLVSPDIAYTAGLLHDIGKVVLDQYISPVTPMFYRQTQMNGVSLVDLEKETFGMSHDEVGGLLAEQWALSESLADAIRHHHQPENSMVNPDLTHHVYLADLLMSRFMVGHELERIGTKSLRPTLERLDIRPEQVPVIVDRMPRQVLFDGSVQGEGNGGRAMEAELPKIDKPQKVVRFKRTA
ncbi:MAG: HDOD domain-containing protein [Thermodesulfobacteriota bacterium]